MAKFLRVLFGLSASLVAVSCAADHANVVRLATTTSVQSAGLLDVLVPRFQQETGLTLSIAAVGSGHALRLGRKGLVDVVWVHSPQAEQKFLEQGYGVDQRAVMRNDYVIVGPLEDPAGIATWASPVAAFKAIAGRKSDFVSRGDDSGTHQKELALWRSAGTDPFGQSWYLEAGLGMLDTLKLAVDEKAYALLDNATFLANGGEGLGVMVQGHQALRNVYSVIRVNPERVEGLNHAIALVFVDWLTSESGQNAIRGYEKAGQALYTPVREFK